VTTYGAESWTLNKDIAKRLAAGARSGEHGGFLSVSPPEEHNKRRTFCIRGGNPITCDSGSAMDS
jgi:hypothetical protein